MSAASSMPGRSHVPALDGLRGLAILLVLLHNLSLLEVPPGSFTRLVALGFDFGWSGVSLFFVLSGFLITGILLRAGTGAGVLRNFYIRRAVRILPLYVGLLLLVFVLWPLVGNVPREVRIDQPQQLWYWLMLSNWTAPYGVAGHALPHLWSIALEEQFYLVWPWLVLGRAPPMVLRLCVVVAGLSVLTRVVMLHFGAPPDAVYMSLFARMDALALGGAVAAACHLPSWRAYLRHASRLAGTAALLFVAGGVATHGYPRLLPIGQTLGYVVLAAVFALVVAAVVGAHRFDAPPRADGASRTDAPKWYRLLSVPALRRVGRYSYAMYLVHQPLHALFGLPLLARFGAGTTDNVFMSLAYTLPMIGLVFGLGAASYHLFERRILALRPSMEGASGKF